MVNGCQLGMIYEQMNPSQQEQMEHKYIGKQIRSQTINQDYQNAKQSVMNLQVWEDYQLNLRPRRKKMVDELVNDKGYVIRKKDQLRRQSQVVSCLHVSVQSKTYQSYDHMNLDQIKNKQQDIQKVRQNYHKDKLYKIQKYYEVSNNAIFAKLKQARQLIFNKIVKNQKQFNMFLRENQIMIDNWKHLKQLIRYLEQYIKSERSKKKQTTFKHHSQNILNMLQFSSQLNKCNALSLARNSYVDGNKTKQHSIDGNKTKNHLSFSSDKKQEVMMLKFVETIKDKEQVFSQYQQDSLQFKKTINSNKKTMLDTNDQIDKYKLQLDDFQQYEISFQKKILIDGNDNRSQGLSWIIQKLIQQGCSVEYNDFPVFLDEKARQYLVQKARLELEIEENMLLQQTILNIYKIYVNGYNSQVLNHEEMRRCDQNLIDECLNSTNQIYRSSKKQQDEDEESYKQSSRSLKDNYRQQLQNIVYKDVLYDKKVKQTLNSLVYDQAKQRIKQIMGSNKEYKYINDNRYVQNEDQSVEEQKDQEIIMNIFIKNNGCETLDQQNHILIYQEDRLINDYKQKSDFITDYQKFSHKINDLKKQLNQIVEQEQSRIKKEIIFKGYFTKQNVSIQQLLSCLFGYQRSTKMILSLAQKILLKTPHS